MRAALLAAALLSCVRPLWADDYPFFKWRDRDDDAPRFLILGYRHWFTSGGTTWRSSFPTQPANISNGTTQELHTSPGMEIFSAEIRPTRRVYFGAEFGTTLAGNGQGTTHYWVDQRNGTAISLATGHSFFDPDHEDFERYTESLNGRSTLFAANVYIHLLDGRISAFDDGYGHSLDVLFGYSRFQESYNESDLNRVFSPGTGIPAQPLGPLPGLNSTYRAIWQGPVVGMREEFTGPHDIFFSGHGMFSPIMIYDGDGFDNVGAENGVLANTSPNFRHHANGMSAQLDVALGWQPFRSWKLEAGYSIYYFWSQLGVEDFTLPDGTHENDRLDYARTLRQGIFLGSSVQF